MEKINVESKNREFISILDTHFQGKANLSRLKLIAMCVFAFCKVQIVGFSKLTNAFGSQGAGGFVFVAYPTFYSQVRFGFGLDRKTYFWVVAAKRKPETQY